MYTLHECITNIILYINTDSTTIVYRKGITEKTSTIVWETSVFNKFCM